MRPLLLGLLWVGLGHTAAAAQILVDDRDELRRQFMLGHDIARIKPSEIEFGCHADQCETRVAGLIVKRDTHTIQFADGLKIPAILHPSARESDFPDLDWTPRAGYDVFISSRRWGGCLEFGHSGLGKSGRFQNWSSLVLVPRRKSAGRAVAHRFVGYWTDCNHLMAGAAVDEIVLPMIEMNAMKEASLQWVWNRCRSDVCTRTEDRRRVKPDLKSDQGGLLIAEPK